MRQKEENLPFQLDALCSCYRCLTIVNVPYCIIVLLQRPVRANRSASPRYTEMSEKEIRQMIVKEQQVRGEYLFLSYILMLKNKH